MPPENIYRQYKNVRPGERKGEEEEEEEKRGQGEEDGKWGRRGRWKMCG
jgi:hypothetical protein